MTNEEAQFKLGAYRPGGADGEDSMMAKALEQAKRDPALGRWLEAEQAHDRAVAAKLAAVVPPAGLREAILAGGGVSRGKVVRFPSGAGWAMVAMAAVLAVLVWVGAGWGEPTVLAREGGGDKVPASAIALAALRDLSGDYAPGSFASGLGLLGGWLETEGRRLTSGMPVNWDELVAQGCKSMNVGGREVFQICFNRDGWYHLYVAKRDDFEVEEDFRNPMLMERGTLAAASWACSRYVYVVTTEGGMDALRRVL